MEHTPGFLRLVADAKTRVKETDVKTVLARLKRGERLRLVDVREDGEWEKGRVKGAIHIGKGVIERDIERLIPDKNEEIVGGFRSALAADSLQRMGYAHVLSMDGGWRGWLNAKGPVEP